MDGPPGSANHSIALADPDLTGEPGERLKRGLDPQRLEALGVAQVLESPIRRTDQGGYGSFGAPTVLGQSNSP